MTPDGRTPTRPTVLIDVDAFERAIERLTDSGIALALWLTCVAGRHADNLIPYPTPKELCDAFASSMACGTEAAMAAWSDLSAMCPAWEGQLELPWIVRQHQVKKHAPRSAAWKAMLWEAPLKSDKMLAHAWTEFHQMRTDLRYPAWTDRTCRLWLQGKRWQKHGRDMLIYMLDQSTAMQWQGLFPQKAHEDTGVLRPNHRKTSEERLRASQDRLREWVRRKEEGLFG